MRPIQPIEGRFLQPSRTRTLPHDPFVSRLRFPSPLHPSTASLSPPPAIPSSSPAPPPGRRSCRYCSMAARRNVRYSALPTDNRDDSNLTEDNVDLRFAYTPKSFRKIPWKSIALALFLLLLGSSLLVLSYFIFTGHMEGDSSQAYGLLFLGVLAFLPGFYETRVAYYSWRGAPGYTFASIPDY